MTGDDFIMNKQELKDRVRTEIRKQAKEITALAEAIAREPELGFKEHKTSAKIQQFFQQRNIPFTTEHAITGVKGTLKGRSSRRNIAVLGEMDAVTCFDHPLANPETGAAHACGHHAQIASMMGCGAGLAAAGVMDELDGNVTLFAVPAEEYVEIEYRNRLRQEGKIRYLGGKAELIRCGAFDGIDMAMMVHLSTDGDRNRIMGIGGTSNGFVGKMINYTGREAHAAGAPDKGVNALNAAMIGLMAVNAMRETFRDEDYVRFHPIITKGGDLVNVIPAEVRLESYVRGKTVEAIMDANFKVNRALKAGAAAIGAEVEISDLPGYLPLVNNDRMTELFRRNAVALLGENSTKPLGHNPGSTDMGDLSHIMPIIHPWVGGVTGVAHTRDFRVCDPEMAYIINAQCMAMTVIDLLADQAAEADELLENYQPKMTKKQYLAFMESIK